MSKSVIIIGLIMATAVHVFMLLPLRTKISPKASLPAARIEVRELPTEVSETKPAQQAVNSEPRPQTQPEQIENSRNFPR